MPNIAVRKSAGLFTRIVAALFILCALGLAIPGVQLMALGGSAYYAIAGIMLGVSALLLWRGRQSGFALFLALFCGTLAWAFWETGGDGWALLPRLSLFVLLGLLLCAAWWRDFRSVSRPDLSRKPALFRKSVRPIVALAVLIALLVLGVQLIGPRQGNAGIASGPPPSSQDAQWLTANGGRNFDRFSRLDQITPENVAGLQIAWKTHLGIPGGRMAGAIQATPLMVDDRLYTCDIDNSVVALDLETGRHIWRFDPRINRDNVPGMGICRGVAFFRQPGVSGLCASRIISTTMDGRMIALDARTGQRCPAFGRNGEVDVSAHMGVTEPGYYYLTSAPVIVRGKVVLGGAVLDGQSVGEPSGAIRGYDAITGRFAWVWDMGRPNEHGLPPAGKNFTAGTPNAWGPITGDDAQGLAFAPLGSATPDYVTAYRSPQMRKYNSSIVALDVETGAPRWSFQTTHDDVWDYDNASPPTLFDLPMAGGTRPAVVIPTKRGQFFVLDRRTGRPLVDTVERPVPQNPVPGERLSPTQPYPVGMPSFGGDRLNEASMWGLTPFDQLWCRIKFREARYDGDFTPISLKPTIVYPGYLGGSEWGGVAIDPDRHLMALNVNHFAMYNQMVPRSQAEREKAYAFKVGSVPLNLKLWPQIGTPYATRTSGFLSPLGTPCIQPPYGEIAVVDLKSRKTLWRQPLGTGRDTGPFDIPSLLPIRMGVPTLGGPLVTKSGLLFIAATQERTFRAFDLMTGKLLWQDRLPAGGHAGPMSYYSRRSGRQFIVVPASGHPQMKNGQADYLVAYALPGRRKHAK